MGTIFSSPTHLIHTHNINITIYIHKHEVYNMYPSSTSSESVDWNGICIFDSLLNKLFRKLWNLIVILIHILYVEIQIHVTRIYIYATPTLTEC